MGRIVNSKKVSFSSPFIVTVFGQSRWRNLFSPRRCSIRAQILGGTGELASTGLMIYHIEVAIHIPEPAVSRKTLVRSAAITWGLVGAFLSLRAVLWFKTPSPAVLGLFLLALGLGFLKGKFIFSGLARRNIRRIRELSPHKEKICLFAFQAVQSYVIIVGMMALGIGLRRSALPRVDLAVLYLAIGSALIYASFQYWRAALPQ